MECLLSVTQVELLLAVVYGGSVATQQRIAPVRAALITELWRLGEKQVKNSQSHLNLHLLVQKYNIF
jgi:hypothetical protein